jgi:polar amino acid transport system substrate-binding protein
MRTTTRLTGAALVAAFLVAACTGGATPSPSPAVSPSPAASPSEAAASPSPSPDACASPAVVTAGTLTVGTDNPAFPPYFAIREGGNNPPWEDLGYTGDPTTGEGFEGAVAIAVAEKMGFTKDQVTWVVVPFANATAPGPKTYDFVINQVSYSPERAEAIDLSDGYYDLNQAIVALKANPVAAAKSIADLKPYKFGAQVGTTSYTAIGEVIAPTQETQVYNDNTGAIAALVAKQIDAIVVDLPTADFIANAGVEIESGLATIVGQFSGTGEEQEYFSLALAKDSELTPCVNQALGALRDAGTLDALASEWLPFQDDVPVLE